MSGRRGQRSAPAAPEERGGDPARGAEHTAQHPFKFLPFRLPGQSQRFGQAARFIQFDIDHLIAPAQPQLSRVWQLSSAQIGGG